MTFACTGGGHTGWGARRARPGGCPAVGRTIFGKALALVTERVDPSNAEWRPEP
jgi:hypothetical protein